MMFGDCSVQETSKIMVRRDKSAFFIFQIVNNWDSEVNFLRY